MSRRNALNYGSRDGECQENPRQSRASTLSRGTEVRVEHRAARRHAGAERRRVGLATGGRDRREAGTTAARTHGGRAGPPVSLQIRTICVRWGSGADARFVQESATLVASELHECAVPQVGDRAHDDQQPRNGVRDILDRVISSYEEIDRRFTAAGGPLAPPRRSTSSSSASSSGCRTRRSIG